MPQNINTTSDLIKFIKDRDPEQTEFHQAVEEVFMSISSILDKDEEALQTALRMVEPERSIIFRVPWIDDNGKIQINRGYRVQFSSTLGPYKGGLRFTDNVNLSIVKFLGFEQTFKNALTGLPLGSGKGGSDFSPKGKSDNEVMRFCQSFMTELYRHIGPNTDVPAGDIGVGGREIGYLFGQYKRISDSFSGVLTGKGEDFGGSAIRPEATGYGVVFYLEEMLKSEDEDLKGKRVLVSGSGNVAQYTVEKLLQKGAVPVTMSDSNGYLYFENGISKEDLKSIMELKNEKRGRLKDFKSNNAKYHDGKKPWSEKAEIAAPCATQNEIEEKDAKRLKESGVKYIVEGANMPSTPEAVHFFLKNDFYFGPAKAANLGGVACSLFEMSQNSIRLQWTRNDVEEKLQQVMKNCYDRCRKAAESIGEPKNLLAGANLSAFKKVSKAMIAQGAV
mmetsp:Transcript_2555/g.9673  ORF Transcript_2555/g.9673 Transcript_2555/m.9673 type:complete len:447 (-) Transcript_2555:1896-3236(-)|eukprot:CAMPEP_0117435378 /NCGR_PEP_ID=MMETSP0759-20121206/450_1 /TAXON_ID=63605 /ORGANISM="Percolomonas cosmopolitus, Strain WS" /LENGTH=446 /DNA_ID=CAMNT_0005226923 /DNA_START=16 /DNA_END=1356 /DNA_ORIENTATION=-